MHRWFLGIVVLGFFLSIDPVYASVKTEVNYTSTRAVGEVEQVETEIKPRSEGTLPQKRSQLSRIQREEYDQLHRDFESGKISETQYLARVRDMMGRESRTQF